MSRMHCKYCREPIRWATTTPRGRAIPLNPDPTPSGNLVFVDTTAGPRVQTCSPAALAAIPPAEPRYTAHAMTCPVMVERRTHRARDRRG